MALFYVGNLKGVGKVWQITACDVAASYGLATLFVGDPNAAAAAGTHLCGGDITRFSEPEQSWAPPAQAPGPTCDQRLGTVT